VYVTWAVYDNFPTGEDAIGFAKSTDGGDTWTSARIYGALTPNGNFNFGIRGFLNFGAGDIRVASFPSMAVDRSGGGPEGVNGNIYICWPQRDVAPAGSDPDIVMIKSSDGGNNWSSPVLVNDVQSFNQYYPWCTVDQTTGQLMFLWYDSRNTGNDSTSVWMASSLDGGTTFNNFEVSEEPFKPKPIAGLAGGYQGDYIGIAALNDVAYPYWADDRTGNYQGWMTVVNFGPPCPVGAVSNPNPVDGATDIPLDEPTLSWVNGSGATEIVIVFDNATIYSGPLVTSVPMPPLSYGTTYVWKVNSSDGS